MEVLMYARVMKGPVAVEAFEEALRGPQGQQSFAPPTPPPGFIGRFTMLDRTTGMGMVVSLWESEEALRATDAGHQQTLDRAFQAGLWTAPPPTEVYEVLQRLGQFAPAPPDR